MDREQIQLACEHVEQRRYAEALELASQHPEDPLAERIVLLARGLLLDREGDAEGARDHIDQAVRRGVPLPALLEACGRYYKRVGDYRRAHDCYALLWNFRPNAMREFTAGLPPSELARYAPWLVRRLVTAARPGFYPLQPVKAALASELGAGPAALAYAQMAGIKLREALTLEVAKLRDYAREHSLLYQDVAPSQMVDLPPPPELGRPADAPVAARTRPMFVCVLEDAIVSSKSNVIVAGRRAVLDHLDEELETWPLDLDVDPVVIAPTAGTVTVLIEEGAVRQPPLDEALSLLGVHSYNFGHWMIEFLPRLWACLDHPDFASVPILIDEQMVPQHREALELMAGPDHPIIVVERRRAMRVRRLWTCSMLLYMPLGPKPVESESDVPVPIDGEAFARLLSTIEPRLEAAVDSDGPRRIYLSRKDSQHRRLVNREEVEAWFAEQGFDIFDPGELPFGEQLRRTRSAEVIVGPDGSGMWNSFLARPGTAIGYLNNPYLEDHWWIALLAESRGQRLSILTGEVVKQHRAYRKFSDYRIDVDALPGFLDSLLTPR